MPSARNLRVLFALLLLGGTLAIRWPALDSQIWNLDEGTTITMAQQVLDGQVLFRDAADNRAPLVPYVKALVLAVAGDWNARAIHISLALMIGLTAILLWQMCRRFDREKAGVFAAISFLGLSTGLIPPVDSLCAHTGWFLIFFSAAGFWLFGAALTRQSRLAAGASGASFGLALLAKQPGLLDFGVTIVILLILASSREPTGVRRLLPSLLAGFLLPLAVTLVYFHANDALADLKFYAWTYNTRYYVPEVPLGERLAAVRVPFDLLITRMPAALALGLAAALGLLWVVFGRERRQPARATLAWLTLGWAASGLLSTMLSGRAFTHYSIQVLPGACLACGWSLAWLWDRSGSRRWIGRTLAAGALLSFLVPSAYWVATVDRDEGFGIRLGQAVQRHSRPEERLFVWGYMPELYVFAQRLPSTRFLYTNWITGLIPWTNNDWLKDTAYAVIPGTAEQLRQDFQKHPPAIVVDTGGLRAYLKYPLREQGWLWQTVLREFAEVESSPAIPAGFHLYRRVADTAPGASFPTDAPVDANLRLELPAELAAADIRVTVRHPAGTRSLELYKDRQLYRRLELLSPEAGTVRFNVPQADLPSGTHRFQAVAHAAGAIGSDPAEVQVAPARPRVPVGPLLEFGERSFAPLIATNAQGEIRAPVADGRWDVQAPACLVYERPPGLVSLEFEYQMADLLAQEPHRWHTDGVDVIVQFEDHLGRVSELFRRHLDARFHATDRGLQREKVTLPPVEPGRITLWFSPGRMSDPTCDWVQLKAVRGSGTPMRLAFRNGYLPASRIDAPLGLALMNADQLEVLMVHAPSEIEFELRPGMRWLTGWFGLLPSAWTGPQGSAGATFEVWHLPARGEPRRLHQAQLDPVRIEKDRGHQLLAVELPPEADGRIRLLTLPTHPQDNSFNHTYWAALAAKETLPADVSSGSALLEVEKVEARFGHDELEHHQKRVAFVHAPSEMLCRLPPDARRLTGSFGLLDSAYTGTEPTEGGRFVIEGEYADGRRTELWSRELDPQNRREDRGFLPLSVPIPPGNFARLILRTDARAGHGFNRAWTFWHDLRLERGPE